MCWLIVRVKLARLWRRRPLRLTLSVHVHRLESSSNLCEDTTVVRMARRPVHANTMPVMQQRPHGHSLAIRPPASAFARLRRGS